MVEEIGSDRGGHAHRFKQPEKGAVIKHGADLGFDLSFDLGSATE